MYKMSSHFFIDQVRAGKLRDTKIYYIPEKHKTQIIFTCPLKKQTMILEINKKIFSERFKPTLHNVGITIDRYHTSKLAKVL